PLVLDAVILEAAFSDETVVPAAAFVHQFGLRDAAREDHGVHREFLNAEMRVEEMDGEDEASREQRLVRVDDKGDVDEPAGEEPGEEYREPHEQAGGADDGHAPEHGEVIEFLPIGPAAEFGLLALAEEPFVVGDKILPILPRGDHGIGPKEHRAEAFQGEFSSGGIAQLFAALPGLADERHDVETEVQEGDERGE